MLFHHGLELDFRAPILGFQSPVKAQALRTSTEFFREIARGKSRECVCVILCVACVCVDFCMLFRLSFALASMHSMPPRKRKHIIPVRKPVLYYFGFDLAATANNGFQLVQNS